MAKRDDQQEDRWAMFARISDFLTVITALIGLGYFLVALYRANWTLALDDILVAVLIGGALLIRMLVHRRRPAAGGEALPLQVANRSRAQMLEKVRATWMPLLDESLQDIVRMDLGLVSNAALVDAPGKRLRQPNRPERTLPPGTPIFTVFDELAGELYYGGQTCIQHLFLRILLRRSGAAPWNYAAFLEPAAGRILLRRVGGGYIFIHRMLMEYFASLELS